MAHARDALAQRYGIEFVAMDQQDLGNLPTEDLLRSLLGVLEAPVHLFQIGCLHLLRGLRVAAPEQPRVYAREAVVLYRDVSHTIVPLLEKIQDRLMHLACPESRNG